MIGLPALLTFWVVAALAAWVQTLTGFALGLILMGAVAALGLMPVTQAAEVTSVLVLVNAALVLARDRRLIDRRVLAAMLVGAMPGLIAGYALLYWLAGGAVEALRLILGVTILAAVAQMLRRPQPRNTLSGLPGFALAGAAGGVLGGMFSTAGPPVIWQLYRQPLDLAVIRVTLVAFFAATQTARLALAGTQHGMDAPTLLAAAGAAPAVLLATYIARRFPPPLPPATIRRSALILLGLSGLSLIATAAAHLI